LKLLYHCGQEKALLERKRKDSLASEGLARKALPERKRKGKEAALPVKALPGRPCRRGKEKARKQPCQ